MLAPTVVRIVVAVALTGHAIRPLLLPDLGATGGALLAIPFWLLSAAGFLAVAAAVWGIVPSRWPWREVAMGAAVASTLGVVLFSAMWPGGEPGLRVLHIGLALGTKAAILGSQLVLHWPDQTAIGR